MLRKVLKVLIPTGAGSSVVCVTMYLTNTSNTSLSSLEIMDLGNRPDVPERDLKPTVPPQKKQETPPSSSPPASGQQDGQKGSQEEGSQDPSSSSSSSSSSEPAPSTQVMEQTTEEAIKKLIQEIHTKQPIWISDSKSLVNTYEVLSRVSRLAMALKQYKSQPQAAGSSST